MLRTSNENESHSKPKAIGRGKACLPCRQKKLKCDGLTPACSKCQSKSEPCQYGDNGKESRVSSKHIRFLEHKLAALKQQAQEMGINELSDGSYPNGSLLSELTLDFPQVSDNSSDFWPPLEGFAQSRDLPAAATLRLVALSFFSTLCPTITIFYYNSIFYRLTLPRSHRDYPDEHFLHSMIALAILRIGEKALEKEAHLQLEYTRSGLSPEEWHAAKSSKGVQNAFNQAVESRNWEKALDCVRANILFIQYLNRRGLRHRMWYHTGIGCQMARHLELHLLPWKRKLLPPAESSTCEWEQNMIFWWTILGDRIATIIAGILPQLDDSLIEVPIPSAVPVLKTDIEESRQIQALGAHSPSFYTTNPSDLVGDLQLLFKLSSLFSRSISISQRKTTFLDCPAESNLDPFDRRNSIDFIRLEFDISNFLESLNEYTFSPPEKRSILISCINFAYITIHEDFISAREDDVSLRRVLNAADQVYLHVFPATDSFEMTDLLQIMSAAWEAAARTYLRVLALKEALGHPTADLENRASYIIECLESFKSPSLATCATNLTYLKQHRKKWIEPNMKVNPSYHHWDWRVV